MKRMLLSVLIICVVGFSLYAQQTAAQGGGPPTSSQTKESAQQLSTQSKTNSSQFEATFADLNARNTSNKDADVYNRLKSEIEQLETQINMEQIRIRASLDSGRKLAPEFFNRLQRLIDQHKAKVAELDAFIAASNG